MSRAVLVEVQLAVSSVRPPPPPQISPLSPLFLLRPPSPPPPCAPQWGALSNIVSYWLLAIPLAHHLAFARGWGLQGLWVGAAAANALQVRACPALTAVLQQARGTAACETKTARASQRFFCLNHNSRELGHLDAPCRQSSWRRWPCVSTMRQRLPRQPRAMRSDSRCWRARSRRDHPQAKCFHRASRSRHSCTETSDALGFAAMSALVLLIMRCSVVA